MASNYLAKGLKRSALTVALGLCFIGGVQAQSNTSGAVNGQASAGDTITIANPATGYSRTVTVGADGSYRFSAVPPGEYQISRNGGAPRNASVSVGSSSNVDFAAGGGSATTLDTVTVVGTGAVNPIDVSSVESATILTEEVIDRLPVARNVAAVAMLAPGTVRTDLFGTNAISFGGASAAENAYYINGFNVTNIRSGLAYNEVPFEGIAETQVKTGGYGAEFGRSLGGVTNVITKRGTNEWKFGVAAVWAPDSLREEPLRSDRVNGEWELLKKPHDKADNLIYTLQAGGPIIKDRLFVYALYQGNKTESDRYGLTTVGGTPQPTTSDHLDSSNNQGLIKLDWNITDNHLLEVTAFRDRDDTVQSVYTLGTAWGNNRTSHVGDTTFVTGGDSYSARWTGYITDSLTLSALYGEGEYLNAFIVGNQDCPFVTDNVGGVRRGCAVQPSFGVDNNGDTRKAFRVDGEWVIGDHTLRFGLDREKINSIDQNVASGGKSYTLDRYGDVDLPAHIDALVPAGTQYIAQTREFSNGGEFETKNSAWYIEDRWQITPNFLAYLGFRSESFENFNADGLTFAEAKNTRAPRFGFSWDVNGDASFKVFGNAGRYYIPIMTNTNVRMSGAELDLQSYYVSNGTFSGDRYQLPHLGTLLGTVVQSDGVAQDPRGVVDTNLSPLFQDEMILGFQMQLSAAWSGGVRAISRSMAAGMDDYCGYRRPRDWAAANGYTFQDDDPATTGEDENEADTPFDGVITSEADAIGEAINHCFLMNPGNDLSANVDLHGTGTLTPVTIPNSALGLPKPTRKYHALEFFVERAWDEKWTMQGSYTFAKSIGNSEGYVNSNIIQDDAGITVDFDFAEFTEHAYGYLPNDRRHALKLFGAYAITDEWRIGGNLLIQSGRPQNCSGSYAGDIDPEDETLYTGIAWYCGGQPSPRGSWGRTDWTKTVGLGLTYTPNWLEGLRVGVDVFNLLNAKGVTATRQFESPAARFHKPIAWQAPRSIRISASYDFSF